MKLIFQVGVALLLVAPVAAPAQQAVLADAAQNDIVAADSAVKLDPRTFVHVELPNDSPLEVVKLDYGTSRVTRSDNALSIELDLLLTVRNRTNKPVEGVALAMHGISGLRATALSAVSNIRLEAGASYAVPARMRADVRWPASNSGIIVDHATAMQVTLDSVLFADGSGYGPDMMRALGTMRLNQAECVRDRRFFQSLYDSGGLRRVIPVLESWATAGAPAPNTGARALAGEAANQAREAAKTINFGAVAVVGAPVRIVFARAGVFAQGLVDPVIQIQNVSGRTITDVQVAWLARDAAGREFRAATLSEAGHTTPFNLAPDRTVTMPYSSAMEIREASRIIGGRVYLRAVQFSDGSTWVPDRPALEAAGIPAAVTNSPEVSRLFRAYTSGGPPKLLSAIRH